MRSRSLSGGVHPAKGFNASAFYEVLAQVVSARDVTWRELGRQTGITPSTLSRMAHGAWPDAARLAVLSAWANLNPADFVVRPLDEARGDSLGAISTVLRSDPNLEPTAAQALEAIIGVAYARFTQEPI
jgi:transcriptional regulator with XRE-family HTH domain